MPLQNTPTQNQTPPVAPASPVVQTATTAAAPVPTATVTAAAPAPANPPASAAAQEHQALNARIEDAIAVWRNLDPEVQKTVLARAEAKRVEEVAWSRSLDFKVSPVLAVAALSIGGLLPLLTGMSSDKGNLLTNRPVAAWFVFFALAALFYAAVMSVRVISPTLHLPKPIQKVFGLVPIFRERHKPQETGWTGHQFFGHTAKYKEVDDFMRAAIPHFADDAMVLRDTLEQGYINAYLNTEKSKDIALAVRGVLSAIFFVALAGGTLALQWWWAPPRF